MSNTKIYKDREGSWTGETVYRNVKGLGYDWRIRTRKYRNKLVTVAYPFQSQTKDGVTMEYMGLMGPENKTLTVMEADTGRVTEQVLKDHHYEALVVFEAFENLADQLPLLPKTEDVKALIRPGMRLRYIGYGNEGDEIYVWKKRESNFGNSWDYVNVTKLSTGNTSHLKSLKEKFGIGIYYLDPPEYISEDELNDHVIDVNLAEKAKNQKRDNAAEAARQKHIADLAKGKKIVKIPPGTKSVIWAETYVDHSDSQTDYFHASGDGNKHVLAFSKTERNNMKELRKAAANYKETEIYGPGKGLLYINVVFDGDYVASGSHHWNGQHSPWHSSIVPEHNRWTREGFFSTEEEAQKEIDRLGPPNDVTADGVDMKFRWEIGQEQIEHPKNYGSGPSYYLGDDTRGGWKIWKGGYYRDPETQFEDVYIAAANGRYHVNAKPSMSAGKKKTTVKPEDGKDAISQTTWTLRNFEHTKTGATIYVAKMDGKVDRDTFNTLARLAKANGGHYSRFAKGGAIPGFHFKSIEDRYNFLGPGTVKPLKTEEKPEYRGPGDKPPGISNEEAEAFVQEVFEEAKKRGIDPKELDVEDIKDTHSWSIQDAKDYVSQFERGEHPYQNRAEKKPSEADVIKDQLKHECTGDAPTDTELYGKRKSGTVVTDRHKDEKLKAILAEVRKRDSLGHSFTQAEILAYGKRVHELRSKDSREQDENRVHKMVLAPTYINLLRWAEQPDNYDMAGVDAPLGTAPTVEARINQARFWNLFGM